MILTRMVLPAALVLASAGWADTLIIPTNSDIYAEGQSQLASSQSVVEADLTVAASLFTAGETGNQQLIEAPVKLGAVNGFLIETAKSGPLTPEPPALLMAVGALLALMSLAAKRRRG